MNHTEMEKGIITFWEMNRIFEKSVEQRPAERQYVFYDGPPFATGLPHYGHILGLTSKDLFPRYWTMKGYRVERRWGWDCHGLPIENIAEKELGIKEKKEIEEMGVAKFNEFCRSKVLFFANEWKKTVVRMGKWIEFDNAYKTMDDTYMETIWHIFKKLYDEGHIYEGKKILMYCPRCETPLSNAEIAMDNSYKDVTEKAITVKFRLKGEPNTYILAWTTTPWTLVGNVALAINPKIAYVEVEAHGEKLILAKARLEAVGLEGAVVGEFSGESLLGKEYEPLYETAAAQGKKGHYVIDGGEEVTTEEGTGVVHMALYGDFDHRMIVKYKLPVVQHVGKDGRLIDGPDKFKGMWFKHADKHIIEDLDERGLLYDASDYTHSYPFCYRCNTPLFYNAVDSWFIDVQGIKQKLIEKNSEISWHPENIKEGRFRDILETAPDWSISRNRFWATAIPVWKCGKCGGMEIIGSIKELQQKAIESVPDNVDLHKHIVDNIHLKCRGCGGQMSRIPEVFDCWLESGSMPYAAKHWPFENVEWFRDNYPCDFVSEYVGQVRAWFYYMHVMGVLLFGHPPFKHVVVTGNMLAADGTKMSKSKGNFPDPMLIFDKYGADALRFYLMASNLMKAQDINFNEDHLKDIYRKVFMLLANVHQFYMLYGAENRVFDDTSSRNLLDKWVIGRVNETVRNVTSALEEYNTPDACTELIQLIDDISTWYVRRSRERFKSDDEVEKRQAVRTLAYVLHTTARLLAPISPFLPEHIYQSFRKSGAQLQESVHLDVWPAHTESLISPEISRSMALARTVVSLALEEREKAKIAVRQALPKLAVRGVSLSDEYLAIIRDEVNVKQVVLADPTAKEISVALDTTITPELRIEGLARDLTRKINSYRKELKLTIRDRVVLFIETDSEEMRTCIGRYGDEIMKDVQADGIRLERGEGTPEEMDIGGNKVWVSLKVKR
ncbi:MAG: isoleucine--tRNA ligase [Candidatus Micrarchaeota archaeon]|nr:isoleucine--tRNA ligase [Candidatus Micrarchaeota archaeon]